MKVSAISNVIVKLQQVNDLSLYYISEIFKLITGTVKVDYFSSSIISEFRLKQLFIIGY